MSKEAMLSVENLRVSFNTPEGSVDALNGVSLQVAPGECLGMVGESGSGKTQLFRSILGLSGQNARVSGKAMFEGVDLLSSSPDQLRKILGGQITMIFQDPLSSLNPYLKMSVQMTEGLAVHQGIKGAEAEKLCIEMMDRVRIPEAKRRLRMYPHEFSGGMRQRMMIAMALLPKPKLIIADEPTTALDVTMQAQVLDILHECRRDNGAAIVFITHDLGVAASLCERVVLMYGGQIMETGAIEDVLMKPRHPYTKGLLNSIPKLEGEITELSPIPGNPINMKYPPLGCPFAERCSEAFGPCTSSPPPLLEKSPGRFTSCYLEDNQ